MAKKSKKTNEYGPMHKMPGGHMMKDSEMKKMMGSQGKGRKKK